MRRRSPTRKLQGEMAEVCFLWRATAMGFTVSKPYGDSARYDFVVDAGAGLLRVQVKSTAYLQYGAYRINLIWGAGSRPYGTDDFDLLAAYIHPRDIWYLIPAAAFAPVRQLLLSPDGLKRYQRWEQWRENWRLLAMQG